MSKTDMCSVRALIIKGLVQKLNNNSQRMKTFRVFEILPSQKVICVLLLLT